MDKEFEKYVKGVDPELKFPKWIKSDEGKFAILLIIVVGVYLFWLLFAIAHWNG